MRERDLRVPVWVAFVVYVAVAWAAFEAIYVAFCHLSTPCQVLVFLAVVLFRLIRVTGSEGFKSYATGGPATLAAPIQPWQTGAAPIQPWTGVWNPALVRPLLDDTEEGFE